MEAAEAIRLMSGEHCPAWEDGQHLFVQVHMAGSGAWKTGPDAPPTHKKCACGKSVAVRR